MANKGFQAFWFAGSRVYFKRDAIEGVLQPFVDLGIIQPVNPSIETEKGQIIDSDGGVNQVAFETITSYNESMEVTCSNMSPRNLALLWLGKEPSAFVQAAEEKLLTLHAIPGELVRLMESDVEVLKVAKLLGVYDDASDAAFTVTDIDASAKEIDVTEDASGLSAGEGFIVRETGLADVANAKSYTVASVSGSGPSTITVEESPAADETGITGAGIGGALAPADFSLYNATRGIARLTPGGAFSTAGNLVFVVKTNAITGNRQINPQDIKGTIEGEAEIYWSRDSRAGETMRKARVSITPSGTNISNEGSGSNLVFTLQVIADLTQEKPAGKVLDYEGDLPSTS